MHMIKVEILYSTLFKLEDMEGLINVAHSCYDCNFISWSAAVRIHEIIQAGEIVSQFA